MDYNFPYNFLLVDNESRTSMVIKRMLSHAFINSRVRRTTDPENALQIIQNKKVDFVISEVDFPQSSGLELLNVIRTSNQTIPFLFLSGRSEKQLIILALQLDTDGYVVKPFNQTTLMKSMEVAWKKRKSAYQATITLIEQLADQNAQLALERLEDSLGNLEQSARLLIVQAKILMKLNKLDEAEECLEHALTIHPQSLKAKEYQGDILIEKGEKDKAKKMFEELVSLSPMNRIYHRHLVKMYAADKQFTKLKEFVDKYSKHWLHADALEMAVAEELRQEGQDDAAAEMSIVLKKHREEFV